MTGRRSGVVSTFLMAAAGWASVSPAAGQTAHWTLDSTPDYVLGASPVDINDQFGRILSVAVAADGGLVVLDANPLRLRSYRPDGSFRSDFSGEGDGPDEMRGPLQLAVVDDLAVVVDEQGKRLRFDLDGKLEGTERFEIARACDERSNVRVAGLLADGAVLVRCEERLFGRVRGEYRQDVGLVRLASPGAPPESIGWFPADSGRTDDGAVAVPRPYAPRIRLLHVSDGDRLFVASSDRPRVDAIGFDGRVLGSVDLPLLPRPTTDRDHAEHLEESTRVGGSENDQRVVREWAGEMPRASETPVIRRLVAGGRDEVWVQGWADSGMWMVIDVSAGEVRARMNIPSGHEVVAAVGDRVVLLARDRFGVETLRVHRFRRGLPTPGG